jgi:predicted dinucleotide-binding enzyme
MHIGIIGTGNMGRALGVRWARLGHKVLFGSRDPNKARAVVKQAGGNAEAGDFDAAAAFGEVVLYTVRGVFPSTLLKRPESLSGKIVIDCNNRDVGNDLRPADFDFGAPAPPVSLTVQLANDAPHARIVKGFNTLYAGVIALDREQLLPHRISVFLCADDSQAKATVRGLAEELGFVGIDCGGLKSSFLVDGVADFIRFQIGATGLGGRATISVHVLPQPA